MCRCLWVCLLVFWSGVAQAQLSDSLYKALPDTLRPKNELVVTDKDKIRIIRNISPTKIPDYYSELKAMAIQLEKVMGKINPEEEKIPYADAIGNFYTNAGEYTQSFVWNQAIIRLGKEEKAYRRQISEAYLNLSIEYSRRARMDSAIAMLQHASTIASADQDSTTIRNVYYVYIPIYRGLLLYHRAIQSLNKYLETIPVSEKWNDVYTDLMLGKANLYSNLYRDEGKKLYADSAKLIIENIMVAKKNQASYWYYGCYSALGNLEYYRKSYKDAFSYFKIALLPQYTKPGSYQVGVNYRFLLYRNACMVWLDNSKAVSFLLSMTIPANDFYSKRELNRVLYEHYKKGGDYIKALNYHIQYEAYSDSIDVVGQRGKVFEAEQKYSVAQKEAAIAVLETKNLQAEAFRNKVIVTAIIIVLLLAILALLLYQRNKRQQAQRLIERQRMADELYSMEQEMELDRLRQQAENEAAIAGQRKAISKNMHDEVSSDLAAVRYFIADLKGRVKTTEARRVLADVEEEVQTVYQQSRDFMHRLNESNVPKVYNVFNLLENLSLRFGKGSNLQIHTQADARLERKLTARQQAELYKITKEAVANCLKHSGANRMDIIMDEQGGTITLNIKDNGQGIKTDPGQGLGMTTMRERIGSLGGDLEISPSEHGLHIHISFPKAG